MNGEQIIKKGKKTPMWIIIGYIICIIAIFGASYYIEYKQKNEKPEPIDFTTDGAIGMEVDQYAYLDVQGLTDEVAIYGDTENQYDSNNDRYYIAFNDGYWYIVDLNFDTIDMLKELQDYTYSNDENAIVPEPVRIYGMTETISDELKKMMLDFYNEGVEEENKISIDDFEQYFGSVLLNVRREPVDTTVEELIIVIASIGIFVILITHISVSIIKGRVRKYLKKNGYNEELARQLDDNVEETHYKDKIIITKDFLVDLKTANFTAFKFSDVKWVHIHNLKYYGVTATSSIIVHLNDGKTKFQCVEIKGAETQEFLGIFEKICEKVPADCLKGFSQENQKEFKQYKKDLKEKRKLISVFLGMYQRGRFLRMQEPSPLMHVD